VARVAPFLVPVVELVAGPWALTGFEGGDDLPAVLRVPAAVLLVLSVVVLVDAYVRLALAPPGRLVRSGVYGWVRHPMYLAATAALVAEAFVLRRAVLLAAAAAYGVVVFALARFWEEPQLRRRFEDY
jgi:protein-S-isoprenylcysteine O-methyltransferase Ste14